MIKIEKTHYMKFILHLCYLIFNFHTVFFLPLSCKKHLPILFIQNGSVYYVNSCLFLNILQHLQ